MVSPRMVVPKAGCVDLAPDLGAYFTAGSTEEVAVANRWYWLKNLRAYWRGLGVLTAAKVSALLGGVTLVGELSVRHIRLAWTPEYLPGLGLVFVREDRVTDYGIVARRLVTDAGVAFLVDDWDNNAQDITNMNFHDSGTGVVAEAVTDTDLGTPAGPTTRATGTKSQPAANQLRTVGTIAYTSTLAITEHGVFNQAARGAGTVLWDRSVFAAVNVVNGDSIQFTYTCTVNAGG